MKTKKKQEYVEVIEVPVGSLVLPPNEIKKAFRKAFNAGMRLHQLHEDDSTYDTIHFNTAFEKIMKSFSNNVSKSKYAKGGTSVCAHSGCNKPPMCGDYCGMHCNCRKKDI